MPLDLFSQPVVGIAWVLAILVAIAVHEYAHAASATALGDPTARDQGRLTLNPFAHVDPIGLLALLFVGFGWGKPVPFDVRALRAPRWGPAMVALAGPLTNLLALIACGFAVRAIAQHTTLPANNLLVLFLGFSFQINAVLLLFNLIPIPPLDGSKLLFGVLDHPRYARLRILLETQGPFLLLALVLLDSFAGGIVFGRILHAGLRWMSSWF